MERTDDLKTVSTLLEPYLPIYGLGLEEWLVDDKNVVLKEGNDLSMFEFERPGVYTGHYFFQSRGKEAVKVSKQMLEHFMETFSPEIVKGLTPLENLGARWLSRKLGFVGHGVAQTAIGPCELFILTRQDWNNNE